MAADPPLVLASASPRRRDLLQLAGIVAALRPVDIDESVRPGEVPADYVQRLGIQKAHAAARPGEVVLAADTAVVLDGEILGKPEDAAHARRMLRRLSGRAHTVITGVAVIDASGRCTTQIVITEVVLATIDDRRLEAYVATGESLDKAGAYAIQGGAAAFVERIDGSWTNVVGLPLVETLALLRAAGIGDA